jgi:hypothetical protein
LLADARENKLDASGSARLDEIIIIYRRGMKKPVSVPFVTSQKTGVSLCYYKETGVSLCY